MLVQFRHVLNLLDRSERLALIGIGALILVNSLLEVVGVALVLPFIAMVSDPGVIGRYPLLRQLQEATGLSDPNHFLAFTGVLFVLMVAVKNGLYLLGVDFQSRFVLQNAGRKAGVVLGRIVRQPLLKLRSVNSSDHVTTIQFAVDNIYGAVIIGYASVLTEAAVIVGIIVLLLMVEPVVTLGAGATLGVTVSVLYFLIHRWLGRFGEVNNQLYTARLRCLRHIFDAAKEIRLLGCEDVFVSEYVSLRDRNGWWLRWNADIIQLPRLVIETLVVIIIVAMVVAALLSGGEHQHITALLGLFAVAAFRMMPSANRLILALGNIRQGEDGVRRVVAAMESPIVDTPTGTSPAQPIPFCRTIALDGVGFAYAPDKFAVRDVSFSIAQGEAIGLIGATGSGKSTLLDVVMGLLPPDQGRILVDGRDIADNLRGWQANLGYVPQTICLIDDSVRRNVAFGLSDDEIDDARVWEALRLARMESVIRALPDGLDAILGESGQSLSGGQRQRIGLARALYRDPPVLCMDEATSALDAETEHEITEALAALQGRKTTIIIAHRLSTVKHCDRLVLMDGGAIRAIGTFQDLLEREPGFQRTVELANV